MMPQLAGSSLLQALQGSLIPGQVGSEVTLFPPSSRYHGLSTLQLENESGQPTAFLERRFVPSPDSFETIQNHIVQDRERLDNIAYRYLNDPEQFWRIADANAALDPDELTAAVGRSIRITLAEGFPGLRRA